MNWRAFATDYDGTIATDGAVDTETMAALEKLRPAGFSVFLVTGRQIRDFAETPDILALFDLVIGENGGVLYFPSTGETQLLGAAPSPEFVAELRRRKVPISLGACVVATEEPHEVAVIEVIKEMGLELQVVFNKGSVMILPPGVNKATGLQEAAAVCGFSTSEIIGAGDAENDHAFLEACGFSVAVANALPALKEHASYVAESPAGLGVAEFIDALLEGKIETAAAPA